MACFGIHLGNSSVCLVLNKDGKSEVIANDSGDRVTPAVLAYNDNEWEIGASAKGGQARNKPTITNNKRFLDSDISDGELESFVASSDCKVSVYNNTPRYEFQSGEKVVTFTADDVACKLYGKMFSIASHAARTEGELRAVLACPLHWGEASRRRLMTAAELAGFTVLQVVSEPAAALLSLMPSIGAGTETAAAERVLVYRLGGSSCDVSVLRVSAGMCSVDYSARAPIGGRRLTALLADYIASEFFQKWKLNPQENRRAMSKLFHHADNCKHVLSTLNSSHVFIESLYEGVDWSQNVSRARFDNLISTVLASLMEPLRGALDDEKQNGKINKIIMCGGSMKIPKLQAAVAGMFPEAEVLNGISPDEVVAQGCAKQAALLIGLPELNLNSVNVEIECITSPIYAKFNSQNVCLFPVGSPVFSEVTIPIEDESVHGDEINISVYEAEEKDILANYSFPNVPKKCNIHATLHNKNITINVT